MSYILISLNIFLSRTDSDSDKQKPCFYQREIKVGPCSLSWASPITQSCKSPSSWHSSPSTVHCGGESWDDSNHQNSPQSAHPHVLFPQPPPLCGLFLFLHRCSQDHGEPHGRRQNHFSCRLCNTILFLLYHCGDWVLFISCDGLRLLRGHLQPSALRGGHVPETLCHVSGWILCLGNSLLLDTHLYCYQIIILRFQHNQSLLWVLLPAFPLLLWYLFQQVTAFYFLHL